MKRSPLKFGKPLTSKKPMRKRSAKREAYLASPARITGKEHMARVARLPCLVCGFHPVEVHHDPDPRDDMRVLPLCSRHHRTEYGPQALHYNRAAFHARHGSPEEMLERVERLLTALS